MFSGLTPELGPSAFDHVAQGRSGAHKFVKIKDSVYHCDLCDLDMAGDEVHKHCSDEFHKLRSHQVETLQHTPSVVFCAGLHHRISSLSLKAWQQDVQASLYWVLMNQVKEANESEIARSAIVKLCAYENMDRVALLELAVWKAFCVQARTGLFTFSDWQDWNREGWKAQKDETFRSRDICLVVKLIRPFLEVEPRPSKEQQKAVLPVSGTAPFFNEPTQYYVYDTYRSGGDY